MYADHSLRLAQEIVTKNFFLRLLRQKGKGGGKLRMIQNGGLGGGVIVCPGVTIGDRAVVGAGSVVTLDIPADSVAAGNPARIIRPL